ncbi:MAG TPA: DegT/DnrJ/EryC1/StrS family aminotransferase [Ktedonobacteraceae bacterium]|nr:DegT/DnrJ/EryC1/StrS family aminotransferase [Ktedonobacteraceae bacterium]
MISIAHPLLGVGEKEAVLRVIDSQQLAQSQQVAAFEQRFAEICQVREAVAVSSGTAALHLALLAHEIGPGDEVITTPFSFAATANVILLVGATPVFVDIEPDTYTLDPELVEAAITARTKAILPVHLYGHPAQMKRLTQIAETHHLAVIEDACQAHAATIDGKPVGGFGTGAFSFYATKNMTTGEGGMITTNDPVIAERVRQLRSHGQQERYVHTTLGYNLRMTDIQAAIGLVQANKLPQLTQQRIANAAFLTEGLQEYVQTPLTLPGYSHVYHQYTIRATANRDAWVSRLRERGVGAAVHYPLAIHQQPLYVEQADTFRVGSKGLAVAEAAAQQVLSLPVHPALSKEDLMTIVKEVRMLCV